jgi:hypothetical protein
VKAVAKPVAALREIPVLAYGLLLFAHTDARDFVKKIHFVA